MNLASCLFLVGATDANNFTGLGEDVAVMPVSDHFARLEKLDWMSKISFGELTSVLVREDIKTAERDKLIKHHGFRPMDYHE